MARVVLENVSKVFGGPKGEPIHAVKNLSLTVEDHEFVVLVGPSGCGKSTTLRMIAGLDGVSSGTIRIDGDVVNDIEPKDRDIAMVFQNYALYPHMTIYENMAFGLKLRKFPKAEIDRRVRETSEILDISPLLDRLPKALSGGQRQRVAVGRAMVRHPKAFLFDEPLSNLDANMRVQMRIEIARLHQRLAATMIYVTHDQVEAMTLGDRIAVMKSGVIQQVADPLRLYHQPANLFVAGFIGSPAMNFFRGTLREERQSLRFVVEPSAASFPGGALNLPIPPESVSHLQAHVGKALVLGVRPEEIIAEATLAGLTPEGWFQAGIDLAEPMGAETYLHLNAGGSSFVARVHPALPAAIGGCITVRFHMAKAHLFDSAGMALEPALR